MIFDVHSHTWRYPDHFNEIFRKQSIRMRGYEVDISTEYSKYLESAQTADQSVRTVIFGGKARLSGLWVPDRYVADYCKEDPEHMIPFLSLDPTQEGWRDEMIEGHKDLGMKGIKLLPMYAGFYPQDDLLDDLWKYATQHNLPVDRARRIFAGSPRMAPPSTQLMINSTSSSDKD